MNRFVAASFLLLAASLLGSCVNTPTDRCYIQDARYLRVREVFRTTGSMQRVEQVMKDEDWETCEANEMRYRLVKDLRLSEEELAEADPPTPPDAFPPPTPKPKTAATLKKKKSSGI